MGFDVVSKHWPLHALHGLAVEEHVHTLEDVLLFHAADGEHALHPIDVNASLLSNAKHAKVPNFFRLLRAHQSKPTVLPERE